MQPPAEPVRRPRERDEENRIDPISRHPRRRGDEEEDHARRAREAENKRIVAAANGVRVRLENHGCRRHAQLSGKCCARQTAVRTRFGSCPRLADNTGSMSSTIRRIGVLTGGGDCPGLNAVIRAVTKTALSRYELEVMGIEDGFLGLIQNRMRRMQWNDVSNILTLGGTILGTSNTSNPRRYAVKRNGKTEMADVTDRVVEHVQAAGLDALICIGGDGTMTGAADLLKHGINCIGVPKTIDNDLEGCERTFGFDTAVNTAAECLDKIHNTAMSHHRVMVVEVMGRNAGWLALHAGVASGSDIILIPEIPYDFDKVCEILTMRRRQDKGFTIVCVSEGAHPKGGEKTVAQRIET